MQLNTNIQNSRYNIAVSKRGSAGFLSDKKQQNPFKKGDLSFTGDIRTEAADALRDAAKRKGQDFWETAGEIFAKKNKFSLSDFLDSAKNKIGRLIKENITDGTDVVYKYDSHIEAELKKNFGTAPEDWFEAIGNYTRALNRHDGTAGEFLINGRKGAWREPIVFRKNPYDDTITFHKDPFFKNLCKGVKEFTVGQFLDFCIGIRKIGRKVESRIGGGDIINPSKKVGLFGRILDNREAEVRATDAFYKLAGIFESASEGIENIASKHLTPDAGRFEYETKQTIANNIKNLAGDSLEKATRKVGKYNTKSERAWNRLGTGLVSAMFASNDYYNESMYVNNDTKKANEAGMGRFKQDMSRQFITATLTYVVLGAFQNKVNKSIPYAVLSLGGVTLFSEIVSRMWRGVPLKPLSPEEARIQAEKEDIKRMGKKAKEANSPTPKTETKEESKQDSLNPSGIQNTNEIKASPTNKNMEVFSVFTDKLNNTAAQNQTPAFTSNAETNKNTEKPQKKKNNILATVAKIFLGAVGLSLGIGFLRSRNFMGIDTGIKSISEFFKDKGEQLTKRRLIMPKNDVDDLLKFLNKNGFSEQYNKLKTTLGSTLEHGALNGQSAVVRKYVPKKEINPEGLYYDLGCVESKGKATALKIITYPVSAISKLVKSCNSLIKGMFGIKADKKPESLDRDKIISFVEKYGTKLRDAKNKGVENSTFKEDITEALTRHFSEANSKNKNTSVAMLSRFLITLISGYFFVNDYRNRSLIESRGEDLERAKAVRNERIGHKVFNFFFNSMFMDLFNTTLEPVYLSSVVGATAVAMATEVTNETAVRTSICNPIGRKTREEIIQYEDERLNDKGLKGKYYKAFMKLTGKKPISEKANKKN